MHQEKHPNHAPIHVALVGYGSAGKTFHAPLISGVPGLQLTIVVSSKPDVVHADWPHTKVVPLLEDALREPDIALVVIATGNDSHFALARQALAAGKYVVVDKPCTVTLEETDELLALAREKGVVLTVFQNRRWDSDFLALKQVLASGALGRIVHFESHFDRYRPTVPDRWRERDLPGSGLWFDLGSHLVDQAVQLFGPPDDLLVDLVAQRDGAVVNDYFHAQLRFGARHPGLRVILHAGALVPAIGPRFVVHGTLGSFVKYGLDTQEDALKAGGRPQLEGADGWGVDPLPATLTVPDQGIASRSVAPAPNGNYLGYYAQLRDFLLGVHADVGVTPAQVRLDMQLLTLGIASAEQGRFVPVPL